MWINFKLFGNGFGLKSPFFDDKFYWLSGNFYNWIGGYGAQLSSIEWLCPKAGTRRNLIGREFVIFNATRGRFGIKWRISWAMVNMNKSLDDDRFKIDELKQDLEAL